MSEQQKALEELHQQTIEALKLCVPVLTPEQLSLLCWHCGLQPKDLAK